MLRRVAIDGSGSISGGAMRYLSQICLALARASPETDYYVLGRTAQVADLPDLPDNLHWVKIPDATISVPFRLLWLQMALPRLLDRYGIDVLLAASDVSTLRSPCPMLLMVHNLNPFTPSSAQLAGWKQAARIAVHRRLIRRCAQRATRVIFVSHWSQQVISARLGLPPEKCAMVYHGVAQDFKPDRQKSSGQSGQRFILAVSEVLEHKNLKRLFEAYGQLVQSVDEDLRLVVAGSITSSKLHRSLEQYLVSRGISDQVKFSGFVPAEELAALYHQAELLAFPSLSETFGLPLVEAMASGLPVAASNIPVAQEICGDAAGYFDPRDAADMAQTMSRMLTDVQLRQTMIQRGLSRASLFSWSRAAQSLVHLMRTLPQSQPSLLQV